jgi:fructoselysine-6-P-deglycase FrlB-like protein
MSDPLGHDLLGRRLAQIPEVLAEMLMRGPQELRPATRQAGRFIITGTGSSEAHARYLQMLLNLYTDHPASYLPLSGFTDAHRPAFAGKTLIVFSQGVSPNAQIALRRRSDFAHTVLFTATTPEMARRAGKPDRGELLQKLIDEGGELIEFPLAEEYTTLIRFVGPMAGYLACLQFAAQLAGCRFKAPDASEILPLLTTKAPEDLVAAMTHSPDRFSRGFNLITAAPISDFAQNLACKFMEGLFLPCPPISDFLQFAHGPFQQTTAHPHPVVILEGNSEMESTLVARSVRMLENVKIDTFVIKVAASSLISIFGFEAALNQLVYRVMIDRQIDQINWPGKGRDDLLYGFCVDAAR